MILGYNPMLHYFKASERQNVIAVGRIGAAFLRGLCEFVPHILRYGVVRHIYK
jgi:hypothetical protein